VFEWFKNLFKKEEIKKITPEQVIHPSELGRETISRAFNSGNPVFGWIDDDGEMHFKEVT